MPITLSPDAPHVLTDYYRILQGGAGAYRDGQELRPLLTDHLDFTGPLAGHRPDSTLGFLRGVSGFIATASDLTKIQDVHDDHGSAVLYTATMPGGPMTFAEFFTFDNGLIASTTLHYNGAEYLDKGGR